MYKLQTTSRSLTIFTMPRQQCFSCKDKSKQSYRILLRSSPALTPKYISKLVLLDTNENKLQKTLTNQDGQKKKSKQRRQEIISIIKWQRRENRTISSLEISVPLFCRSHNTMKQTLFWQHSKGYGPWNGVPGRERCQSQGAYPLANATLRNSLT